MLLQHKVWHTGWDIPTMVALREDGMVLANDAHGHTLYVVSHYTQYLRTQVDPDFAEWCNMIRRHYEMKPTLPDWMRQALDAGWTPNSAFNIEDYDS